MNNKKAIIEMLSMIILVVATLFVATVYIIPFLFSAMGYWSIIPIFFMLIGSIVWLITAPHQ